MERTLREEDSVVFTLHMHNGFPRVQGYATWNGIKFQVYHFHVYLCKNSPA